MKNRRVSVFALLTAVGCCAILLALAHKTKPVNRASNNSNAAATVLYFQDHKAFLEGHCLVCHQGSDPSAGLDLTKFLSPNMVTDDLETWQQVLDAVEDGYMPPEDHDSHPTGEEFESLKQWTIQLLADAPHREPPRKTMRRLNRTEFENTIRDLFRLKQPAFSNASHYVVNDQYFQPASGSMPDYVMALGHVTFAHRRLADFPGLPEMPGDPPVEHGFDNQADSLCFSPLQMEACFEITNKLLNNQNFPRLSGVWESLFVFNREQGNSTIQDEATRRLSLFLPRAFRRPVSDAELNRYSQHFEDRFQENQSLNESMKFTESMKSTVMAILLSPRFLFREESCETDSVLENYAIASRLSYFLWTSMPDDELFQAAREGRLQNDIEIRKQVRRMLSDRRIKSLATSFGMQWLKTRKSGSARPDPSIFPEYYLDRADSLPGAAMMVEQLLLFETIMIENRSILEFIDSDFAYLNSNLMDWYDLDPQQLIGFQPVRASHEDYYRIQWPDKSRGGVLTSGATMLATSATTRTSPVYRGAWFLDVIFNRPPPPPPANIPSLSIDTHQSGQFQSMRERLLQHRLDPTCAVCHNKIDPIGFVFEQFDAVGRFRPTGGDGQPVDASGAIDGKPLTGIVALKRSLLKNKTAFANGFVEHLMKYATGRALALQDEPAIARITAEVARQDFRFSKVIEEVAVHSVRGSNPGRVASLQSRRRPESSTPTTR